MSRMQSPPITTAEQLASLHEPGFRHELVRGELRRMSPAGWDHGEAGSTLQELLNHQVRVHRLGSTTLAETGFLLARDPDTVLAPDIAFVSRARLPSTGCSGYFPGPPDLAVEVISPGDRPPAVAARARRWLRHGAHLVWIVDPAARTVTVHAPTGTARVLGPDDVLGGGDVVPGFAVRVHELFPDRT